MVTTTVRIPEATWLRLRRLAARRQQLEGGRASASGVIAELVEAEAKRKRAPREASDA